MNNMNGNTYKERNPEDYHKLQVGLLKEKGGSMQRGFLVSMKSSTAFVSSMDMKVPPTNGKETAQFTGPLTEKSFIMPTKEQEQAMYESWRCIPPSIACRMSFWADVTLDHVRSGKITQASWLASDSNKTAESGEERIEFSLSLSGNEGRKAVDDCVRTVLRQMSGLPAARGNRSLFVDCPFGRAWWRERIIARIVKRKGVEDRDSLLDVVRYNKAYWENLVQMIVSRNSVLGSVDVQDAFVNGLAKCFKSNPNTRLQNAAMLVKVLRRFSNMSASREIGALEFDEISEIVDDLLARIQKTA